MRRILIQHVLPFALCLVPLLAAALVAAAAPSAAINFYFERVQRFAYRLAHPRHWDYRVCHSDCTELASAAMA